MRNLIFLILTLAANQGLAGTSGTADTLEEGKKAYDYYCYQCHAYAGDASTLATRFLDPVPRDFTRADPDVLTRERMLAAVTDGRASTAMKSFSRVLNPHQREAVVDYVRREFMRGKQAPGRYHTLENGWPEHRQKYSLAYPFAQGRLATDTPPDQLNEEQTIGLEMFLTSCMSCHDQGKVDNEGVIWRARSSSFPRRHYDHRLGPWDAETSATPYRLHDRAPDVSNASADVRLGQIVFLDNCAFCHGADGTGKNWIGSFMEPPAADLTGARLAAWSEAELEKAILLGVPGSTMPAWRGLLDASQLDHLLSYLDAVVLDKGISTSSAEEVDTTEPSPAAEQPKWDKN